MIKTTTRMVYNFKIGFCDTGFPSVLKLQQRTHNQHELTKSTNSQIINSQFGDEESLRRTISVTKVLCWLIEQLSDIFSEKNKSTTSAKESSFCRNLDQVFAVKTKVSEMNIGFGYNISNKKLLKIDITDLVTTRRYSSNPDWWKI